jgi:hypothetical protein
LRHDRPAAFETRAVYRRYYAEWIGSDPKARERMGPRSSYAWRWIKQIGLQLWSFGRDQIVGLILAVLILLFQLHYRLIQAADAKKAELGTILYPYLALLGLYLLYEAIRAPFALDRERAGEIEALRKSTAQREHDRIQEEHTRALEEHTRQMHWRSLHETAQAIRDSAKLPSGPNAKLQIEYRSEPCVIVTNEGDAADFWAVFDIEGAVPGERIGLSGRWAHTNSSKARIVKGQACRILLGKLEWDLRGPIGGAQWHVFSTTEQGAQDTPAIYTSIWGAG